MTFNLIPMTSTRCTVAEAIAIEVNPGEADVNILRSFGTYRNKTPSDVDLMSWVGEDIIGHDLSCVSGWAATSKSNPALAACRGIDTWLDCWTHDAQFHQSFDLYY